MPRGLRSSRPRLAATEELWRSLRLLHPGGVADQGKDGGNDEAAAKAEQVEIWLLFPFFLTCRQTMKPPTTIAPT